MLERSLAAPNATWAPPAAWTTRALTPGEAPAWEELIRKHPASRAITPRWEELAGWKPRRIGLFENGRLAGGALVALRRLPALPLALARIRALLVGPTRHTEMLQALLTAVERYCRRQLVVETELRLRIPATDNVEGFEYHRELARVLTELGYRPLDQIDSTYLVRIDRDDDSLLASFANTTRGTIRKALKLGAVVSASSDPAMLEQFYDAYLDMTSRKGTPPLWPRTAIVQGLQPLIERGHAQLFIESYGGRPANMTIVDTLGLPHAILGTRSIAHVNGDVPGACQVLEYGIMKHLRGLGHKYYDLGGCEGPEPIKDHPNFGVWSYKYRFQGAFVQFLPYFRKTWSPARPLLDVLHRMRGH